MKRCVGRSYFFTATVLCLVGAVWGINPPVMKLGLQYLAPAPYNAARMLVATVVALTALAVSGSYRPFEKKDAVRIAAVSGGGFFLFQLCFAVGVERTTAGNASFMLALLPVSVVVINRMVRLESLTKPVIVGISLSLLGIVLIVVGSGRELSLASRHLAGTAFILVAQISYAYYTVFSRPLLDRYSVAQVFSAIMGITTVLFLAVSAPSLGAVDWQSIPTAGWASILFSGIFALSTGNFLWIWGTGRIGSLRASVFNNLAPVFAVVTGYLLLGETFGPLQIAGAMGIFAGICVTRNRARFVQGTASHTKV